MALLGNLLHSLQTGDPASAPIVGPDLFAWYADHPEDAEIHVQAMAAFTAAISDAVIAAYDFSRFARIMDVGGGSGQFLPQVLIANPLTGVLFDMPHVVAKAGSLLGAGRLSTLQDGRWQLLRGRAGRQRRLSPETGDP